jgi:hypothetical protein
LLEAGELEAAILHPFTGALHRSPLALWRQHDADRMIEKERAPIPHSPITGSLVVKEFHVRSRAGKPLPTARIWEMIYALQEKVATAGLKRPQFRGKVPRTPLNAGDCGYAVTRSWTLALRTCKSMNSNE